MDVVSIRQQIPATANTNYLNTGWSGPSPRSVVDQIKQWLEYESCEGPTTKHVVEWHSAMFRKAREAVADLINSSVEEVSLTQNTTEGLNVVLNGIRWRAGDEVVTCDLEHDSVLVPAYILQERHGVKVRIVSLASDESKERILEKFKSVIGPHTRLVFVSHVQYCSGLRLPVRELADMVHSQGGWLLLDGAQGVGNVEVDVRAIDCDFYALPGHKWLLGPEGTGGIYIRGSLVSELKPWKVSGRAARTYNRVGGISLCVDDITKFELTTTNVPLWAGFVGATDFIRGIGVDVVAKRGLELAARAKEKLKSIPQVQVYSPTDPELSSGLTTFGLSGSKPKDVLEALWERGRVVCRSVDWPEGIRFSSAFFNTEEEIDQAVALVRDLAKEV